MTGPRPQSAYTPIISGMKNDSSNFGLSLQAVTGVVLERQEAQLQGLTDPKIVWQCTLACYFDKSFIAAGDAVNGQYMTLGFLPFAETKANKMDANFVKYVGKDKLSGFASWGFTTGLLFEQAAKAAAAKNGNNGLTRANLMTELKNTHAFNSDGMTATTDIGNKVPSNCFMIEQYKNGKFVRVYPDEAGHVRLQGVEPLHLQGRPQQQVAVTARASAPIRGADARASRTARARSRRGVRRARGPG